jgi:hypothetical protein
MRQVFRPRLGSEKTNPKIFLKIGAYFFFGEFAQPAQSKTGEWWGWGDSNSRQTV